MIILPDGTSGKTVEAASFPHLNITFSTGDVAVHWGSWVKMCVNDNCGVSHFFLLHIVYVAFEFKHMKRKIKWI